jgi:hypothetical protein
VAGGWWLVWSGVFASAKASSDASLDGSSDRAATAVRQDGQPQSQKQRSNQLNDRALLISKSLAGWNLGLQSDAQGEIAVWFARLLLGWIEPESGIFFRADSSR